KDGKKCEGGDGDEPALRQRAPTDANNRLNDDRKDSGFEPEKQRLHASDMAILGIDQAERSKGEQARQYEQGSRDETAADAMQQPADIDRELVRFGARQQHAVVKRMQKPRFADPALPFNRDAGHDGDLAGGV